MKKGRFLSFTVTIVLFCCAAIAPIIPVGAQPRISGSGDASSVAISADPNYSASNNVYNGSSGSAAYPNDPSNQRITPDHFKSNSDINTSDRFIIKYKSTASYDAVKSKLIGKFKSIKSIPDKANNTKTSKSKSKTNDISSASNADVIQVDTDTTLQSFESEINSLGLSDQIEYIQPDYALSMDSLDPFGGLTLEMSSESSDDISVTSDSAAGESGQSESSGSSDYSNSADQVNDSSPDASLNNSDGSSNSDNLSGNSSNISSENPSEIQNQEKLTQEESGLTGEELTALLESGADINVDVNSEAGVSPAIVAVIDTGMDINQPALAPYVWNNPDTAPVAAGQSAFPNDLNGWDFTTNTNQVYSSSNPLEYAHGTHIAGIIAQTAAEANSDIKIMPLKVFRNGIAYTSDIITAIDYAAANGASVVNCSFGATVDNPALKEAIKAHPDILFVCAVGNSRRNFDAQPSYPAGYQLPNVISVASTNADDGFSYYSNYGVQTIDIAARGRDVLSTLPENQTGLLSGTSMSAGFVSGAAAAVEAGFSIASTTSDGETDVSGTSLAAASDTVTMAERLKTVLLSSADTLSNLDGCVKDGKRLDLHNALSNEPGKKLMLNPAEDFNINGYAPATSSYGDGYSLFSVNRVVKVSSKGYVSMILKQDGTVWTWGNNEYGQCGNGTGSQYRNLTLVDGIDGITDIAAGFGHCYALKSDGTVWAWGLNNYGQLGNGTNKDSSVPVEVIGLTGVTAISSGNSYGLAIRYDGTLWAWGYNANGELGDNSFTDRTIPVQVVGLTGITSITSGDWHNLAIKSNGTLWNWGYNSGGQVYGTSSSSAVPIKVDCLTGVTAAAGGYCHSLAIKSDGTVMTWGVNSYGQLGNGTEMDSAITVSVDLTDVTAVSAGTLQSYAIKSDGTVWAWGWNMLGQLGDGTDIQRNSPVQVVGLADITMVSGGNGYCLALKSDGTVWAWGYNIYSQIGDGQIVHSCNDYYLTPIQSQTKPDDYPDNYTQAQVSSLDKTGSLGFNGIVNSKFDKDWFAVKPVTDLNAGFIFKASDPNVQVELYDDSLNPISNLRTGGIKLSRDSVYYIMVQYDPSAEYRESGYTVAITGDYTPNSSSILNFVSTPGKTYTIALNARNITSFYGQTFTIAYDPSVLELDNCAAQLYGAYLDPGAVPGTNLYILFNSGGVVVFAVSQSVTTGESWSGTLTMLKFRAKTAGFATVALNPKDIIQTPAFPTSITLSSSSSTVKKGTSIQLSVTVNPAGADSRVAWASSSTDVATVDHNGLVTAVKTGTVCIIVTSVANPTVSYSLLLMVTA